MNKKQRATLIIWAILLISIGLLWINGGKQHCDYYRVNDYGNGCVGYSWDLSLLIAFYLIISAPAAILYFLLKKNKQN